MSSYLGFLLSTNLSVTIITPMLVIKLITNEIIEKIKLIEGKFCLE